MNNDDTNNDLYKLTYYFIQQQINHLVYKMSENCENAAIFPK